MYKEKAGRAASPRGSEAPVMRWCGIGIHAVAAASIYADHGEPVRGSDRPPAMLPFDSPDYATD